MQIRKHYLYFFLLFSLFTFLFPVNAHAADIYIQTNKPQILENEIVTATVYINTSGVSVNNAEGVLSFPADLLKVESVVNSASIFSLWVEQPTFSNTAGTISFNGGVPNPGYNGASGRVVQITFKAKKSGTATLAFSSAAIRANDGLGTNVIRGVAGASIGINSSVAPVEEVLFSSNLPGIPNITSVDMPHQESWYSSTQATFSWSIPNDTTATQLLIGSYPDSIPTVNYSPAISTKTLTDLTDGTWYLHVRFKNANGWGKIAHRKIKIDTTTPTNLEVTNTTTPDDLISLNLSGQDSASGIQKYVVYVDGHTQTEASATGAKGSSAVVLPPIKTGDHQVMVRAYDYAGNYSEKTISVTAPETKLSKITKYPEYINKDERIEIKGETPYPNTELLVWIKEEGRNPKSYVAKSKEDRSFAFSTDRMNSSGLVTIWTETSRAPDVKSAPSEKVYTVVKKSPFVKLSSAAIEILSYVTPLILLILGLIAVIYFGYHKLKLIRRRLLRDLTETEREMHKIFKVIKDDVKRYLKVLEKESKRKYSKEEDGILDELSNDLREAEKYFEKKLKDIEKKDLK